MLIDIIVPEGGTTYTYLVDELSAEWEFDGANEYVALDNSINVTVERQRLKFILKQIFQKVPGGTAVISPTQLHQEMIYEVVQNDNASRLSFDLNGTPYRPTVYPAPEGFNEAQTKKGSSQLMHEMKLLGKWYDPSTQGGQDAIDNLTAMKAAL